MTNKITQGNFVDTMNKLGGLDADFGPNGMSDGTRRLLEQAGVSGSDLWRVAGKGGQAGRIDTVEEMKELFSLLDRKDHDGSARSISADSVQGAAYQALVTEMLVARARANANEARLAPEAPRVPSQRARETFRQDMQAVKEMTSGLEEHEDIADQVGGGVLKGTHLAMGALEVLETATAVAPELGTVVTGGAVALHGVAAAAGPIIALGAALYEIGEANEAGKRYRENEKRVSAFAAGVASALDPEYSQHQPPHGELRAMYDKGRAFVAGLSAEERRQLEDALVLGNAVAAGTPSDDARVGQFYRGDTYYEGIKTVWGQGSWKPLGQ